MRLFPWLASISILAKASCQYLFPAVVSQVSNMRDGEIGREGFGRLAGSIVALHDKNGGETIPHNLLGIAQNVRIIIDHHIVIGGIGPRNFVQVFLLVREDQDAPPHRLRKMALGNLFCLKDQVAVRNNHG